MLTKGNVMQEESMTIKGPGGRKRIHEITEGDIVVEVWLKPGNDNDRVYFDLTVSQKYDFRKNEELSEFIQLRYAGDTVIAVVEAQKWIYNNRDKYYPSKGRFNRY